MRDLSKDTIVFEVTTSDAMTGVAADVSLYGPAQSFHLTQKEAGERQEAFYALAKGDYALRAQCRPRRVYEIDDAELWLLAATLNATIDGVDHR